MRCAAPSPAEEHVEPTAWAVCWQAAVGREFFPDPSLHERVRARLIGAHREGGRRLVDFVLLPTEIHALAELRPGDSMGGVARAFGNVVSRWVREVQPVRSPVLAGPFRAQPVGSFENICHEVRMLAWRPVFLGLCATPTHYSHGALRVALGLTPAKGYDARPLLMKLGESIPEARASLRRLIARRPSEQDWRAWELTKGLALATGSVGPRPRMARSVQGPAAQLIAAGGGYGIDGALALLAAWVAVKVHAAGVTDLHAGSNAQAARARALVACLAVTHRLCSAASVARYFGRAKSTLSEQMAACRAESSARRIVETPLRRILEESAALRCGQV